MVSLNRLSERKITAGFVLALTLLLTIEAMLYRSTVNHAETGRLVAHTHEVIVKIQELILRLTDAETARRGFVMSQRERYLVHYSNAVERASQAFQEVRKLTADDPAQQQACSALEALIRQRFAVYSESIAAQAKGADTVRQLQLTEKGQAIMEEIRGSISRMQTAAQDLRRTRQAAADASFRETKRIALVGSAASVTLLVSVFILLLRENHRRRNAEAALQKGNEELELRVRQRTGELTQVLAGYQRAELEIKKLNDELEQRVAERTSQLETANKELEAFSYSVSHDLRAPLRHIGGFVDILQQEAGSEWSPKCRQYLDVIGQAASHMGRLIDNLLAFSRMGRAGLRKSQVDLNALVEEVLQEAQREMEGRQIDWQIAPLPTVLADHTMLKQVWVNLISNAVKYTRGRDRARIEIACEKNPASEWQFSVHDNGAGFDMRYADKLFGVFQRLHRAEEFEGTGIGLANVRRIVHRHGGRTWADGKLNEGATFYFTLPA